MLKLLAVKECSTTITCIHKRNSSIAVALVVIGGWDGKRIRVWDAGKAWFSSRKKEA